MFTQLFGAGYDAQFDFDTLFTEQVEAHNRDWALVHGKYTFECYQKCGAYAELMELLQQSKHAPQFEFKITGTINGVPLLGKPDLRFIHSEGAHVILDWKVTGYCSKSATSPCKNYRMCRDTWDAEIFKPTRGSNGPHKNYSPIVWKGVEIHDGWLEDANEDWANQLAIYAWMLGEPVGNQDVIVCIDQIAGKPIGTDQPLLRVANHRARISTIHQQNLIARLVQCWGAIQSGHIFEELSREENDARCIVLDQQAMMTHSTDETQRMINEMCRSNTYK
jgi:hypothetical protein